MTTLAPDRRRMQRRLVEPSAEGHYVPGDDETHAAPNAAPLRPRQADERERRRGPHGQEVMTFADAGSQGLPLRARKTMT